MIVIDTETSGVDTNKNGLISIGAVDFDNPSNRFYGECYVFENAHIDDDALKINGFNEQDIRDTSKMSEKELCEKFIDWTKVPADLTLAGENPSFDRDFLRMAFLRSRMNWPFAYRTVDLHSVAISYLLSKNIPVPARNKHFDFGLDEILEFTGLPENPLPHHALHDALLEAEAISRLIYGKNLLFEFEQNEIPEYLVMP